MYTINQYRWVQTKRIFETSFIKIINMKTLTKIISCVAFAAIIATLPSCKKDHDRYAMADQDFVTQASSGNMFEIAAGNLALHNSSNTDIQAYGNHMVTDHGKAATEMANLASSKGLTVPTAMLAKDQTNLNTLAGLSGAAFDRQFAAMMVTSHQQTIDLFNRAASDNGVPDADLRSFASGKLPTLNAHLQEAQQLQTKVSQ